MNLGPLGIWSGELRFARDRGAAREAAAELDALGFGALWLPGGTGTGAPLLDVAGEILDAAPRAVVATGVLSIWVQDAASAGAAQARLRERHPGRFLLGLGSSHAELLDDPGARERLARPFTEMSRYLDELDVACPGAQGERVLAALRPRMLGLARDRCLGSHPYLVTPDHTAAAREVLGAGPLLGPEQTVVLETDPARAREIARAFLATYLGLPNYMGNLLRFGFDESDLRDGGSDRFVDAVVGWGDEAAIASRIAAHREAGADHVALQVLAGRRGLPLEEWRRLAALA
jgi:probable F420-dependent oxidoreductase